MYTHLDTRVYVLFVDLSLRTFACVFMMPSLPILIPEAPLWWDRRSTCVSRPLPPDLPLIMQNTAFLASANANMYTDVMNYT